jgi:hypothetical protein
MAAAELTATVRPERGARVQGEKRVCVREWGATVAPLYR